MLLGAALMVAFAERTVRPIPITQYQSEFLNSKEWLTALVAGRGAGKTRIGAHRVCRDARADDPWMAVSPDSGVVTETTLPTFLEVSKLLGCYIDHKLTPYPKVRFRTVDGGVANIVFRSGEKPKKLHGPNKAGLWIDEASLQSINVFLDAIPTLRWKGKMGPCLLTLTPKGKINWTFDVLFSTVDEKLIGTDGCSADGLVWMGGRPYRPKPKTRLIHATSRDNPFLPPEFYETLRGNMSSQLAEQELEGNFLDISGLMFRREWFKLVDEAPRDALRVRYWDKACLSSDTPVSTKRGLVSIKNVVAGDLVLTRKGWRKVLRSWMTKISTEIMTVVFSDGRSITGTPDHLVWDEAKLKWTELQSLTIQSRVVSHEAQETAISNRSNLTAGDTPETINPSRNQSKDIFTATNTVIRKTEGTSTSTEASIATYGSITTVQYPMAIILTTLTETGITTTSEIFNSWE